MEIVFFNEYINNNTLSMILVMDNLLKSEQKFSWLKDFELN